MSQEHEMYLPKPEIFSGTSPRPEDFRSGFTVIRKEPPIGFVPTSYPPSEFGRNLQAWASHIQKESDAIEAGTFNGSNGALRPIYHSNGSSEMKPVLEAIDRTGVYNSIETQDEGQKNINILDPEHDYILERARLFLRSGAVTVLLPFASEAGTIGRDIHYAENVVGPQNVLAIDAGTQTEASVEARATGVPVVNQKDILQHVNWDYLKQEGILPPNFKLKGAKGLTLAAGNLALESIGQLNKTLVVQHDTDIVNPGPGRQEEAVPGDYCALDHLAIPYAYPLQDATVRAVYNLRTGEGRNNEPWHMMTNNIAGLSEDEKMKVLGKALGTIAWPLTGERLVQGDLLRTFPRATGMETETQDNFCLTGIDLRDGKRGLMQVANPNPKTENKPSPRTREFAIVDQCCLWGQRLTQHIERTGRHPDQWNLEDIASFNRSFGGRLYTISVPSASDHHPNQSVEVRFGYLLPSIDQLRQLPDAVDWESIRQVVSNNS